MTAYLSLFFLSFLAATLIPTSSELTLAALLSTNNFNSVGLLATASLDRKSTRLNSSHVRTSRMPSSA